VGQALQRVSEERTELATETQEALQALAALEAELEQARAAAQQELDSAREEVEGLTEQVSETEPAVREMVEQVEAAARALAEQAEHVRGQLEEGLGRARTLLAEDVAQAVEDLEQAIRDAADDLASGVSDCKADLESAFGSWREQLTEVREFAEGEFERSREHAAEVTAICVQECAEAHRTALQELEPVEQRLEAAIEKLMGSIGQGGEAGTQNQEVTETAVAATNGGLESMLASLDRVKQRLAQFTFVTL
jgi:DNA repair exonuclease SbcCD ATPase subunit